MDAPSLTSTLCSQCTEKINSLRVSGRIFSSLILVYLLRDISNHERSSISCIFFGSFAMFVRVQQSCHLIVPAQPHEDFSIQEELKGSVPWALFRCHCDIQLERLYFAYEKLSRFIYVTSTNVISFMNLFCSPSKSGTVVVSIIAESHTKTMTCSVYIAHFFVRCASQCSTLVS